MYKNKWITYLLGFKFSDSVKEIPLEMNSTNLSLVSLINTKLIHIFQVTSEEIIRK